MDDQAIVELYWNRSEHALSETSAKYGKYCYSIAYNILENSEDADESVNDTYLAAWGTIPPNRPAILSTFLGKLTRRISIDCLRKRTADKRGGGEVTLVLDELEDCIAGKQNVENAYIHKELTEAINCYLDALTWMERNIFLCRYWYLDPIADIASNFGLSQSKVASMLYRLRKKLRLQLEKEGYL